MQRLRSTTGPSLGPASSPKSVTLRVIKRQCGFVKVRCEGTKENTAQPKELLALSNSGMVQKTLMALDGVVRLKPAIGIWNEAAAIGRRLNLMQTRLRNSNR